MNIIRQLSPHVADLIAAGEVVERPASVVKELLENSFDAGAKKVTLEVQRGGMGLIRVTDDGCGMTPEDASTAFLRHATSKLRDEFGLEAIGTLGFRGEALAAIASVSRVQLLTRLRGSEEGVSLLLEAGTEVSRDPAGCPEGTTILVRDLFFNTPARLKFMKKDSAELAAVTQVAIRCALSHPEVSIRYLHDGKEEFQTAGDGKLDGTIYSLLGRDFSKALLPVRGTGENMTVEGYVSTPAGARGNRKLQYFFLNGRAIRSQLLQAALEQAYRNSLFTGRYPACVLNLSMKPNQVDVNVHPAKTEVRFLQENAVFTAVHRSVLSALNGETEKPEVRLPEETGPSSPPPRSGYTPVFTPQAAPKRADAPRREPDHSPPPDAAKMPEIVEQLVFAGSRREYNAPSAASEEKPIIHTFAPPEPTERVPEPAAETPVEAEEAAPLPPYRILGEAFREYIIVETGEELLLIDKHAAHERMLFDALKARQPEDSPGQLLLSPAVCALSPEDKARLLANLSLLQELGIEAEDFGGNDLLVRQLPQGFDAEDAEALLCEVSAALQLGQRPGSLGVKDESLATMACKAAVKAGRSSDPLEWVPVAEAVLRGDVKYCPHGRPVSMTITKKQLDRNFRRI